MLQNDNSCCFVAWTLKDKKPGWRHLHPLGQPASSSMKWTWLLMGKDAYFSTNYYRVTNKKNKKVAHVPFLPKGTSQDVNISH